MTKQQPQVAFDKKVAASYDDKWAELAPLRDALHLLVRFVLCELPDQARVLCVGAGTGAELLYLAREFPSWSFTAVEPSEAMLDVCRHRAEAAGISSRCVFHHGYLDSLPDEQPFDAATSLLVSQFLLEPRERTDFFRAIRSRIRAGARLVSADLASEHGSAEYHSLLEVWLRAVRSCGVSDEKLEKMAETYGRDVAILAQKEIAAMIEAAGFRAPVLFAQTGLIHAWFATAQG